MNTVDDRAEKAVAHIFNSAVAAWAISAAWELGALDELNDHATLDAKEFATTRELDFPSVLGMFRALAAVGIVERQDTIVTPGATFTEVQRTRSFFHWLTRGSAELFRQMPDVLRTANRTGDFYQRDAAAIGFACREISTFCYDPWFWKAVENLSPAPSVIADLGCGSGERIMQLLRRYPDAKAVGVDIAPAVLEVAKADAQAAGLADRVTFRAADVLALQPDPDFAEVDLLTCFMMGHDFWPRQQCVATLSHLRAVFPRARTLLVGDATLTTGVADRDLPVFTVGFELAHDMMGTFIPTIADWESVFEEGGWRLREKHSINIAAGEVIFELERI